jgi:hypothetical protein
LISLRLPRAAALTFLTHSAFLPPEFDIGNKLHKKQTYEAAKLLQRFSKKASGKAVGRTIRLQTVELMMLGGDKTGGEQGEKMKWEVKLDEK